jgi:hypothetical protein
LPRLLSPSVQWQSVVAAVAARGREGKDPESSIVKSIAINSLTARGRLLPATGSRESQQQSQSQPEGSHGGVAVSAHTSSVTAVAVTAGAVTAGAVTANAVTAVEVTANAAAAVAVTAERVAGRDKAVRTHTKPILQVGSSHYRNGRRKAVSLRLLHPGRPRGLTLCGIPRGHHQSIEREDSAT